MRTARTTRTTDGYDLFDEIGRGGMASVHVGVKRGSGGFRRAVALKRLRPEHEGDEARFAMMVDEARLASRINHPNVVHVVDVFVGERGLTLVMPLVRGVSLDRLLERLAGEACPVDVAVAIASDALAGLEAAHGLTTTAGSLGVIHRDVSPSNLLVGADGSAQLLDFGIAKSRDRDRIHVTRQGERKGKLAYMAPEQLAAIADHRADVYGVAAVLWEMLVGRPLFSAATPSALVDAILSAPVPRPSRARAGLPRAIDPVVLRGLERDPSQRWSSAREMRIALEAACPRATPAAVAAWVESVGRVELDELDRRVVTAEREAVSDAEERPTRGDPSSRRRPVALASAGVATAIAAAAIALGTTDEAPRASRRAPRAPAFDAPEALVAGTASRAIGRASASPLLHPPPRPASRTVAGTKIGPPRCDVRVTVDAAGRKHYEEVCAR